MLENTATFMATQVNSSDPSMIENVGKSLLVGLGNILTASASEAKYDEGQGNTDSAEVMKTDRKQKVRISFVLMSQ